MANGMPSGDGQQDGLLLNQLQEENRRLEAQVNAQAIELNLLRARFARYETALRGSQVVVYTQDRGLRYTSVSHPTLGHSIADLLGRADEDVLPASVRESIVAIKREAISTGQSQRIEFSLDEAGALRWYDLHVEALRNDVGDIVGITCASLDVTERKEGEAHLRLLLRELTHRSKNLLAVIQAMARQTARHVGSIDSFLSQFGARLQALAASHDLLIRESWYGASLNELVRSQLTAYLDGASQQVTIEGPDIALKPEAAQNLGLALHELSANAARFGALSTPEGQVSIEWRRGQTPNAPLEFSWRERLGPRVRPRRKRGFGTMVIETNLARALDAQVDMVFDPAGLRCQVVIPASQVVASMDRNGTGAPGPRRGTEIPRREEIVMKKPMTALAAMAIAAACAVPMAAQAQDRTKVGALTCDIAGGIGMIIASKKEVTCLFTPSASGAPREVYTGSITKFGLDIGATSGGEMVWSVFAPSDRKFGALAGNYGGASAEATVGVGAGANVLVGGSNRTVTLQPVSVQGQTGLNLAVGVSGLELRPAR